MEVATNRELLETVQAGKSEEDKDCGSHLAAFGG